MAPAIIPIFALVERPLSLDEPPEAGVLGEGAGVGV